MPQDSFGRGIFLKKIAISMAQRHEGFLTWQQTTFSTVARASVAHASSVVDKILKVQKAYADRIGKPAAAASAISSGTSWGQRKASFHPVRLAARSDAIASRRL